MSSASNNRRLFLQVVAGIAIVLGTALFLPVFGSVAVKSAQTKSLSNGKQLATACILYAQDHEGRFPAHLSELSPDYVQKLEVFRSIVLKRDNKDRGLAADWLYFGAGFTNTNPPTLLLASPQAYERKDRRGHIRIFIAGDTSGRVGPESDYQEALAKTRQEITARFERPATGSAPTR